jgi:hypothetical protein
MSYDLIFWRGRTPTDASKTWNALHAGEDVDGLQLLRSADVVDAFRAEFEQRIRVGDGRIEGPGFELAVTDGARYLHVTCAWQLIQTFDGRTILARLRAVAERLGCHAYNPQTEELRPAITPKAYATSPAASSAERSEIEDASEEDMRRAQSLAETDRASSMGTLLEGVVKRRIIELSWRSGFIEGATFRFDGEMLRQPSRLLPPVRYLLESPSARSLRNIAIKLLTPLEEASEAIMDAIVTAPHTSGLWSLEINSFDSDEVFFLALGDLTRLFEHAPGLQSLEVNAATLRLRPVVHSALRRLTLRSPEVGAGLPALAESRFEKLERLTLWCGTKARPATVDAAALAGIIERAAPALEHVWLDRVANADLVLTELARRTLPPSLKRINFDTIDESFAAKLLELRRADAPLPRLSIKECRTSDALALELASAFGEEALDLRHQAVTAARKKAVADRKASSPAAAPAPPTGFTIAPGARVKHAKFGGGTIVAVEGPEKIVVRFDDGSEKKLAPKFVSEP